VPLRDRKWRRFLTAPDAELLSELYEPALATAVRYDRCCAYFSSTVLATAARGFAPFVERLLDSTSQGDTPAVRLLVNEELSRADVDAMLHGEGVDALAERLSKRLLEPKDALEHERLALLGLLVRRQHLEVRVGVMRNGQGILHAKFGLIEDAAGDVLVFSGSGNETSAGLIANYEELEVTGSWTDPERFENFRRKFDELWADRSPVVTAIPLPDAVRERLVRYADDSEPVIARRQKLLTARQRLEAWMRWSFALESAWLPGGGANCDALAPVSLWPHQHRVVEEASAAWPEGRLLCDEVGMGKTIEAIMVLRRLLAGRGVRRALLLVPAGLLKQWQGELREKGGLLVPRLEGQNVLVWPDGRTEAVADLTAALHQPILLVSRELARLEQNREVLLAAPRWDIVLLDEAHAARRANQVETEFNSATLLLELLRRLQLEGRARGIMLLSATPMQTHPWEPWDLLGVLGEGAPWLADFGVVRSFYRNLRDAEERPLPLASGRAVADIVAADPAFPPAPVPISQLPQQLFAAPSHTRSAISENLRAGAPLGRRMHRNTRATLRLYHAQGLLERPPAGREIQDVRYDYRDPRERDLYDSIQEYVERRFRELEEERPGKGFVMTVYRRRAASSPLALRRSLERRKQGLETVARGAAADAGEVLDDSDRQDLDELLGDQQTARLPSSLPDDPTIAARELRDVNRLLSRLEELVGTDSKLEQFDEALRAATLDGRACLVFSEFTDTVEYLRDHLFARYADSVACYTGDGGTMWTEGKWQGVSKDTITEHLGHGDIRVLLCSDAASEGLNLQSASALLNYDLPWNPARVEQRIGRIDRIGQRAASLRIVNLMLADSVDDRVYEVLSERCDLFRSYVGAMQPVLSVARQMLLGVQPFSVEALKHEAARSEDDAVAQAAFRGNEDLPSSSTPAGVALQTFVFAHDSIGDGAVIETPWGARTLAHDPDTLSGDPSAVPYSPYLPWLRDAGKDLLRTGETPPLVVEAVERGAFRTCVAVWAGEADSLEVIDRAARLEALLGQWDGALLDADRWREAREYARATAMAEVNRMESLAAERERVGLERQVAAARRRLLRELAKFLACAAEDDLVSNEVFHAWMSRSGQTGQLLRRAHALVGYPEWPADLVQYGESSAGILSSNQRKNVLLGTPLEAAIRDPRWAAVATLEQLSSEAQHGPGSAGGGAALVV